VNIFRPIAMQPDSIRRFRWIAPLLIASASGARPTSVPICGFRKLTGRPCPFCGVRSSLRSLLKLQPRQAIAINPLGPIALVGGALLLLTPPRREVRLPSPIAWAAGCAALWAYKLVTDEGQIT
jgi:hypothetical protein